jgi:hypothetical protein
MANVTEKSSEVHKIKAYEHESYGLFTFIAMLLPIIGIILGVAYLIKDSRLDKKLGEHLLAIGVLFLLIWSAIGYFFLGRQKTPVIYVPTTNYTNDSVTQPNTTSSPTWDVESAYTKIQTGMTKAQVESTIGKIGQNCVESEYAGIKMESCSYGNAYTDGATISVVYKNGVVEQKGKAKL